MHTRRKLLAVAAGSLAVLVAGSTALTACGAGSGADADATTPRFGGTITIGEPNAPINWDPHVGTEDVLGVILRPVLDSLVSEAKDGTFAPWLAKSWTVSPDGLTYIFTLRDDVTFSDGTRFDAEAVKDNFEHVVAPTTASRYAKSLLGPYAGTDVLAPNQVAVHLKQPYSQFLHAISETYLGFESPKELREHPRDLASGGQFIVGTGAYTFASVTEGQQAVFTRRSGYNWAPQNAKHAGLPYLDGYTIVFLREDQARVGAATSGQIDIADQVPANQLAALRGQPDVDLVDRDVSGSPYTYYLNTKRPLLSTVEARRVVQYGVDIAAITQGVFRGEYQRATSVLSDTTRGFNPQLATAWGYDKQKAEGLLDSLGYTQRDAAGYRIKDGQRFHLEFPYASANTTEERRTYDLGLQDALKQIGVELVLTELDATTYIGKQKRGDYDISGLSWSGSDPSLLRDLFYSRNLLSAGGANKAWVTDPEIDGWLDAAENTTDVTQQNRLYQQVQAKAIDQAYALPTYVAKRSFAVRKRVHGLDFDLAGWPQLGDTWVAGS